MTIAEMREHIRLTKECIQPEIAKCMGDNAHEIVVSVREQLYSGIDGNDAPLSPSYETDPYFNDKHACFFDEDRGHFVNCYRHPERYIEWKMRITPPEGSDRLGLPPRQSTQPNLFIAGTFHGSIDGRGTPRGVEIFTFGWDSGPAVESKYGSQIFGLGSAAVEHFNESFLWPWLKAWYRDL